MFNFSLLLERKCDMLWIYAQFQFFVEHLKQTSLNTVIQSTSYSRNFLKVFVKMNNAWCIRVVYSLSSATFICNTLINFQGECFRIICPKLCCNSILQVFHVDAERQRQKSSHQFSSLERQWARVRERHYGRIVTETGGCSERLVSEVNLVTDAAVSHNTVCIAH